MSEQMPRPPGWIWALLAVLVTLGPISAARAAPALSTGLSPTSPAIELLRLKVPATHRQALLNAEQQIWGPWLDQQEGFLSKELFWDPQREEAVVLIHWRSRECWKAIPPHEVAAVQQRFDALARAELQKRGLSPPTDSPPFPLLESVEWLELSAFVASPMGRTGDERSS